MSYDKFRPPEYLPAMSNEQWISFLGYLTIIADTRNHLTLTEQVITDKFRAWLELGRLGMDFTQQYIAEKTQKLDNNDIFPQEW